MSFRNLHSEAEARELERLIRARGDYDHVGVRVRAGHLNVEVSNEDGERWVVARATPIRGKEYGLSFRNSSGRYEPMPVSGSLLAVAEGLTDLLGAYLDRANPR
jgi:hypothetical protein